MGWLGEGARIDVVKRAEKALGLRFRERQILEQSLVHRSYLNENPNFHLASNERLEYLGDAVVELIVTDYLYQTHADAPEGVLTTMRATVVRAQTLARAGKSLGLDRILLVSRGEAEAGARAGRKILGQAFEAVVGAIYLDRGLETTREFVLKVLRNELASAEKEYPLMDPKSRLQETVQAAAGTAPVYELVATTGSGHRPHFSVQVRLGERVLGSGEGDSKQDAEQSAARMALEAWTSRPAPASLD